MAIHSPDVDLGRLSTGFSMQPTGIVGDPARASAERGKELFEIRIRAAIAQMRSQMAAAP